SRTPRMRRQSAGKTTAAATTGPASGPRPTSSTPTSRRPAAQHAASRASVGGPIGSALALLPDARRAAREPAQVVELGAADAAAAHQLDRGDRGAVEREDPLDPDAGGHLADREGLADPAAPLGDADALERLQALLVTLADADLHAHRVARLEPGDIAAQPLARRRLQTLHRHTLRAPRAPPGSVRAVGPVVQFAICGPQVGPPFGGEPLRFSPAPGGDGRVVAGAEDRRHFPAPVLRGPGPARRAQEPVVVRVAAGGLVVAERAGQQP